MPNKQQAGDKARSAGSSKANLGQKEARSKKADKEQLKHMGGEEKAPQQQSNKSRSKQAAR